LPGGRADHLFAAFQGLLPVRVAPGHLQFLPAGHELAWFDAALDFIRLAGQRPAHARHVRTALAELGYNVSDGTEQIIALEAGRSQDAGAAQAAGKQGVYGAMFCAPATPRTVRWCG
jgi:CAI-1 autoinducer synthase